MEQFKQELIDYLNYYNFQRRKAKLKGLPPAIYRQQALSVASTIFILYFCLTFWGQFNHRLVILYQFIEMFHLRFVKLLMFSPIYGILYRMIGIVYVSVITVSCGYGKTC